MQYFLLKSEPNLWSYQQQEEKGIEVWDGVRNYQARNYMRQMQIGDLALFYHSSIGKEIVGIVEVVTPYYPDCKEPRFGLVAVKAYKTLTQPVTLAQIKQHPELQDMLLVKQSRLSVMPVTKQEFKLILKLSNTDNDI